MVLPPEITANVPTQWLIIASMVIGNLGIIIWFYPHIERAATQPDSSIRTKIIAWMAVTVLCVFSAATVLITIQQLIPNDETPEQSSTPYTPFHTARIQDNSR